MLKIEKHNFSGWGPTPVLVYRDNSCPVFLPFTYLILNLRAKSYETCYKSMISIKLFYLFYESIGVNLEEEIIAGNFQLIIHERLDQFVHYLYVGLSPGNPIPSHLFDSHIRKIRSFLVWTITRYATYSSQNWIDITESKINSSMLQKKSRFPDYKSIGDGYLKLLRAAVIPTSDCNPFRIQNRLRNWLIFEVFVETGIRASELLILKVPDIYKDGNNYYLKIRESSERELEADTRWKRPSLKNQYSVRVISVSQYLYILFEKYLHVARRKKKSHQHNYLFTSERGLPVSMSALATLFKCLEAVLKKEKPDGNITLSPHSFRHTFAERMLQYLLEVRKLDMERAKDELRNVCGWSLISPMPNYYARKYIAFLANRHNQERIAFSLEKSKKE